MQRRWIRTALRLFGPALLVLLIARMKDRAAIGRAVSQADALTLLLASALGFANLHMKVVRWGVMLRARGVHYPRARAWAAYLGSSFVSMLTPGRVGDVLRVHYLRHDAGVPYSEGLATVVMDRLCDLYILAIFCAVGVVRFGQVLSGSLAWAAWLTVGATVLGPLVLFVPGLAEAVMERAFKKLAPSLDPGGFSRFLAALRAQIGRPLAAMVALTVGAFLVNYVQAWLIGRALHLSLTFVDVLCLLAIASLLGLLPISVSGVGVREAFFALAFPALGLEPALGVTFGLLVFAVIHVVLILSGFVAWQVAPPPSGGSDAAKSAAPGSA
jgi:uncharacterized protein (TIRG00374 family)